MDRKGKKYFKKAKGNRFCDHCQRSGHVSDHCFKIRGYPNWHQGPKDNVRPRRNIRDAANMVSSESIHVTHADHTFGIQD